MTSRDLPAAIGADGEPRRSPSAIRSDIERTRERIGENVEALGAQLNPSHLADRVKESIREATIGKVQHMASNTKDRMTEKGRDFAQTIRENPLPAAMAAAGIGWLLLSRRDQGNESERFYDGASAGRSPYQFQERSNYGSESARDDEGRGFGEKAHEVTERVSEKAQELGSRVVDKAKATGERIADSADSAMHDVRDRTRKMSRRVEGQYQENPMALGAVALALGMAIGMSAPRTRREVEMVGDASDNLMDKAREKIASTKERVEGVIDRALPEVKEVVRDAAREEGLAR